ncbi:MAG: leucine-rich repeat domain-containing protein [Oligoflexales bacterium]
MPKLIFGLFLVLTWSNIGLAKETSFLEMCFQKNELNMDQRHTLQVLLTVAKASNCEQAAIRLASIDSLTLIDKGIKVLDPIGTLKNIKQLNLMTNQIIDLRPLRSLDQLQTLNLSENRINNIEPISALITLKKLWLDSNAIFDIGPIEANINLVLLSINDNQVNNVIGLKRLWKLKHVSHWGNPIKSASQSYSVLNP